VIGILRSRFLSPQECVQPCFSTFGIPNSQFLPPFWCFLLWHLQFVLRCLHFLLPRRCFVLSFWFFLLRHLQFILWCFHFLLSRRCFGLWRWFFLLWHLQFVLPRLHFLLKHRCFALRRLRQLLPSSSDAGRSAIDSPTPPTVARWAWFKAVPAETGGQSDHVTESARVAQASLSPSKKSQLAA